MLTVMSGAATPRAATPGTAVPDPGARPGERRTQEQRRTRARTALLAAAAELVAESGIRAVTFARVGERAGYSRGMVTHHFGSKQGLLEALVQEAQAGLAPGIQQEPPGLDRLLRFVEAYLLGLGADSPTWQAFLVLWADAVGGGDLAPMMRERDAWFRDRLRADVVAGQSAGTVRSDVDAGIVALRVVAELRGIGMQRILDPEPPAVGPLAAAVVRGWAQQLGRDAGAAE